MQGPTTLEGRECNQAQGATAGDCLGHNFFQKTGFVTVGLLCLNQLLPLISICSENKAASFTSVLSNFAHVTWTLSSPIWDWVEWWCKD